MIKIINEFNKFEAYGIAKNNFPNKHNFTIHVHFKDRFEVK